ncbi:MAG: hypothetical protein J7501_06580, partial [Bdellovibrio sp.]|nr:hypothetical protein [Bdellovibrio sp.]
AWVNPTTGVYEIIATTAASSSGDGGVLTSAKFKSLGGLWVDNNNDILVADATIIRKINTRVSPMTISRYLGGGSDSSDYVTGATNFLATSNISHITVSSNGDLFFRSSSDRKVRKYTVSTGVVSTINLSGTGNRYSATQDNTLCTTNNYFTTFDANGNVDKLVWYMQIGVSTSCPFSTGTSEGRAMAVVDPTTGVSFLPAPAYIKSTNGSRDYANFYNDKSGNVYAAYGTTGSAVQAIYKFDSTNLTWTLTYGSNQPGTCPDGTSQASCAISASALTFNSQGQLFYVDTKSKSIRTVDSEGKIRTLVGDRLGSDDGRQVLATRFGSLTDVKSWNSNGQSYITVMDFNDVRVREFQPGETIYTLVGMQYSAVPAVGSVAAENPFANTADSYPNRIMVSEAGDLYLSRAGGTMSRVPRATGLWEDLSNGYGYGPALIAINSQKLLVNTFSWTLANGAQDSRFVTYDLTAKTTANVLRNSSAVSVPSTVCADGTAVTACVATGLAKDTGYQGGYDVVTNMWLIPEYNSKRIAQFSADGTGTVGTYATLSRAFSRFDINRSSDLSTNYIYTCATDGKLYKYDLNNSGAETLLAFPNSTFACSGGLRFDKFRNSLLFTYTQNGLSGVAEYVNP